MRLKNWLGLTFLVVCVIPIAVGIYLTLPHFTHAFATAEDGFGRTLNVVFTALGWLIPLAAIGSAIYGGVVLFNRFSYRLLKPDANGNYPKPLTTFLQPIEIQPGNAPVAQISGPHSYYNIQEEDEYEEADGDEEEDEPIVAQPQLSTIVQQLRENALEIAYGVDAKTGKLITSTLPEAVHIKMIGSSGFGKSCLAAAVLAQVIARNSPDTVRIALLDLENKTSRPFQHVPHIMNVRDGKRVIPLIALDADEVAERLGTLVKLLNYRKERDIKTPLVLAYVEEFLSLKHEILEKKIKEQMLADFSILALRGRKYGICLMGLTQVDYSTKELQEAQAQFRSKLACSINPNAARAAGFRNTELLNSLYMNGKPGEFLFERPGLSTLVLAPFEDEHFSAARSVIGGSSNSSSWGSSNGLELPVQNQFRQAQQTGYFNEPMKHSELENEVPASYAQNGDTERENRIASMMAEELSINKMLEKEWGITASGGAYQVALGELRKIQKRIALRALQR